MNFTTIYEKKEGGKNYKNMNSNSHFEKAKKQKKIDLGTILNG